MTTTTTKIDVNALVEDRFDLWSYDGDPGEAYCGGGFFLSLDKPGEIVGPGTFARETAEFDARSLVLTADETDGLSEAEREAVTNRAAAILLSACSDAVEEYAANREKEERAEVAELTAEIVPQRSYRVWTDEEYGPAVWWDNGGGRLWKAFAGDRYASECRLGGRTLARFVRTAAAVPGFFGRGAFGETLTPIRWEEE